MQEDATKFWSDFEAETGERVAAKSIGSYYEREGEERGTWGLLIVTDASFRFKHFPNDNMILGLFRPRNATPDAPIDIVVPLRDIAALRLEKRGFLARVFGSAFPRFELAWRERGAERSESFSTDPSSDVMRLLGEAAGSAHSA